MRGLFFYAGVVIVLAAAGLLYRARENYENAKFQAIFDGGDASFVWWPAAVVGVIGALLIYASSKVDRNDDPA